MKIYPPVGGGSATTDASLLTSGTLPLARLSGITTTELDAAAGIVSGQIAGLSLSKLTDGTLTTALALDYGSAAGTGAVTAGNNQILNTSTGIQTNVQTGKTIVDSINGTAVWTAAGALCTTAVPIAWSTTVAFTAGSYQISKYAATSFGVNVPTGSAFGVRINDATVLGVFATEVILPSGVPIVWNTNVALTAGNYTIGKHSTTQLGINVATSGTIAHLVNAVVQQTFSVNGMQFNTFAGAVTAATPGIYSLSGSQTYNVPSAISHIFAVNGVTVLTVASAAITLADATNLVTNSTTGTKIGTATTQKIGFWNVTPVVQPAGANQAAITDSTGGTAGFTLSDVTITPTQALINNNFASLNRQVDAIRTALVNAGIIKGAA